MDATLWTNMFCLDPVVSIPEKVLRALIVYLFLVIGLRLAGKRELAQLNPLDLVVLLTISNTVQNAIIGHDDSVTGGLIGAMTLLVVNYLANRVLYAHPALERAIEGDPTELIHDGQVDEEALKRELITLPELKAAAHRQGFDSLAEVARAVLEPSGTISFFAKKPTPEELRQAELTARLDAILAEVRQLRLGGAEPAH
jgi:uncharacterized membrane protein YcaP (DUF421 family)